MARRSPPSSRPSSVAPSFGVLYAGEMGAAVGARLVAHGYEVYTSNEGRSAATAQRARDAGLRDLGDFEALVARVDYVLSFVTPDAAAAIGDRVASLGPAAAHATFVDLNSIGPETAGDISARLAESGIAFIDGSIHGQARHLESRSRVYLSGPGAERLSAAVAGALHVVSLGEDPTAASTFKMLLASVSKTLVASFLQTGILARSAGTLEPFLEQTRHFYPGILEAVERMAPTYPTHARRRVEELGALEDMLRARGLRPGITAESRRFVQEIANVLKLLPGDADDSLENLIESLATAGVLRAELLAGPDSDQKR